MPPAYVAGPVIGARSPEKVTASAVPKPSISPNWVCASPLPNGDTYSELSVANSAGLMAPRCPFWAATAPSSNTFRVSSLYFASAGGVNVFSGGVVSGGGATPRPKARGAGSLSPMNNGPADPSGAWGWGAGNTGGG